MKLELHTSVLTDDLPAIYAFIARNNPTADEHLLGAVQVTFDQLLRQPECGVHYPTRVSKLGSVRMLPVHHYPNYLIFYRVENDTVRVLYVVHGARHLPRIFRQEPRD